MPVMRLNLALLFVFQLATLQFLFRNRENLLHRLFEFVGRLLLGCGRHATRYMPIQLRQLGRVVWPTTSLFFCRRDKSINWWLFVDNLIASGSKEPIEGDYNIGGSTELTLAGDNSCVFFK